MRFKFPYIQSRPQITAKLRKRNGRTRYFNFLLDSGADFSLISKSDAIVLGIDYSLIESKEIKVEVANLT